MGCGHKTIILGPKQNPSGKAAFDMNRFKNIRRHMRFVDKKTWTELDQGGMYRWATFLHMFLWRKGCFSINCLLLGP